MAEKPSPDKFKSNSAMMAGFAAIWLTIGANEASHFLVPGDESVSTFGYEIEVPEGFGSEGAAAVEEEVLVDIKPLLAAATVEDGEKVFRKCQSCHTVEPYGQGGRNGTGPSLNDIVGSTLAQRNRDGFGLSESLLSNVDVWTYDSLNAYLNNPKDVAPQGTMSFIGLPKPKDRAAVIKYMMANTTNPPEVVLDPVITEEDTAEIGAAVEGAVEAVIEEAVDGAEEVP